MTNDFFYVSVFLLMNFLCGKVRSDKIFTCYYKFNEPSIDQLDPSICTHIILIGETVLDNLGHFQRPNTSVNNQFSSIKKVHPRLRLLVSVTGSNPAFSTLVESKESLSRFASESVDYLREYKLDGIDLDWEFPSWSWDAKSNDRQKFTLLLKALRDVYGTSHLVTVPVSGPPTISRVAYDIDGLNRFADFVQVMNYDFHVFSYLHPFVGFNAPLRRLRGEFGVIGEMNSESSMKTWLNLGLWRNKTVFGIPTYNLAFRLVNAFVNKPYALAESTVDGFENQAKICELLKDKTRYTYVWNERASSPYLHGKDKLWITFEDERSVRAKTEYAMSLDVAGVMAFHIGSDDYVGTCGLGKYPLLHAIRTVLNRRHNITSNRVTNF